MTTTIIHFVRHGIVHNPKNIFYGRLSRFGLSREGLQLTHGLIPFFSSKPIQAIYTSPLLRARQTANVIHKGLNNIPLSISRYLLEVKSPYDGHPLADLEAKYWDIYTGTRPPSEQPMDIFNRSQRFIARTIKTHHGHQTIAVTHADNVVFLTLWAKGFDVSYASKSLIEHKQIDIPFPTPASVTTFIWNDGKTLPEVEYFSPDGVI